MPESVCPEANPSKSIKSASPISDRDRDLLRRLAHRVAELAARPIEAEKRDLWLRHNMLEPTRPVIFCDPENGWNEILTPDRFECEGGLARGWEWHFRREIFWAEELKDDRVIPPDFFVSHAYSDSGWGLQETRHGGGDGGSYVWDAPLQDLSDLSKLRFPEIAVDEAATMRNLEIAEETLGDILKVRLKTSWWWTLGMTWVLVNLRGLERIMFDMADEPEGLHRLMAFLRDGHMARLDFLERNGLLFLNNDGTYVGSGGFGWTTELPQPDFDGRVRARDMWGFAESQETVGVSPAMFEEFIFPYQLPILERFGLNCYGCCEPLDRRWRIIEKIPNLRRISVSPWSKLEAMAERLGGDYVFSRKPNPSDIALDRFDEDAIRENLRKEMRITRNCRAEYILKDVHTLRNDPNRVIRWVRIAKEEAEAI